METDQLYRVQEKDLPKLKDLLTVCFQQDPLYQKLIPDDEVRAKLMPELFECDLTEYFSECEIFSDSEELNSMIVVCDHTEHMNPMTYRFEEFMASVKTDHYLITEDPSLKTFHNFVLGKEYLDSRWTNELNDDKRLHIIYLAVRPSMQHRGISGRLIDEVIGYADKKGLSVSLETHNEKNLPLYEHHEFELYKIVERHFGLKQYCMVRKHKQGYANVLKQRTMQLQPESIS